jgi:hypothetical protein
MPRTAALPLQIFELLFINKLTQVFVGQILGFEDLTYIMFHWCLGDSYYVSYFFTLDGAMHVIPLIVVENIYQ